MSVCCTCNGCFDEVIGASTLFDADADGVVIGFEQRVVLGFAQFGLGHFVENLLHGDSGQPSRVFLSLVGSPCRRRIQIRGPSLWRKGVSSLCWICWRRLGPIWMRIVRRAFTSTCSPVNRLRPGRAFLSSRLKLPKPASFTGPLHQPLAHNLKEGVHHVRASRLLSPIWSMSWSARSGLFSEAGSMLSMN